MRGTQKYGETRRQGKWYFLKVAIEDKYDK